MPVHRKNDPENSVDAYLKMLRGRSDTRYWHPFLLTVMFKPITGSSETIQEVMEMSIAKLYSRLLTRTFRRPRNIPTLLMPFWMAVPDWPVPKNRVNSKAYSSINGGRHYHIAVRQPVESRMDSHFQDFVDNKAEEFLKGIRPIAKLHCIPIDIDEIDKTGSYILKSLSRKRIEESEVLILPKSHSEMPAKGKSWEQEFIRERQLARAQWIEVRNERAKHLKQKSQKIGAINQKPKLPTN